MITLACASLTAKIILEPERKDSRIDSKSSSISPSNLPRFREKTFLLLLPRLVGRLEPDVMCDLESLEPVGT